MGKVKILELKTGFLFLSFILLTKLSNAQFSLDPQPLPPANHSIGMVDVNGDFQDDLVLLTQPRNVEVFIQTANKGMVKAQEYNLDGTWDWTFMLGDYNNNNRKSIITGGAYNQTVVNEFTSIQNFAAKQSMIQGAFLFAQGANSADINNDGYLDIFICHDDADSHIYLNDQNGGFEREESLFDFTTTPSSDGSGNYGSIWTYIDEDDKLDLYIAKCRLGVPNTEDPRRINQLYLQNDEGTFDRNSDMGLDLGWLSWTADFGDIDNDGDLDAFIINHDHRHQLMENINNNEFREVQAFADLDIDGQDYQGVLEDLDNDGLLDMIITGENNTIVWNRGDGVYVRQDQVFDINFPNSVATGDLNNDGAIDVLVSYALGLAQNTTRDSRLYYNTNTDNNYLSVSLRGVESNREAVGAKLICYSQLGQQMRVIVSGEGYGLVNSLTARFGLAQDEVVDSLVVMWPNGDYQSFQNIEVNQHLVMTEGADELRPIILDYADQGQDLCAGEFTTISVEQSEYIVNWQNNNNTIGEDLLVDQQGFYTAELYDEATGNFTAIPTLFIDQILEEDQPILETLTTDLCEGESITLQAPVEVLAWSNGETGQSIEVTESGSYSYTAQGLCGVLESNILDIELIPTLELDDVEIEVPLGEDPIVELDESLEFQWSFDESFANVLGQGNVIALTGIDMDTTLFVRNIVETFVPIGTAGLNQETSPNNIVTFPVNPGMVFDALVNTRLESVTVRTTAAGERLFQLFDSEEVLLDSRAVFVEEGIHAIELNFDVLAGEGYILTTDSDVNEALFGNRSPFFTRTTDEVDYPYQLDGVARITGVDIDVDEYYFFYNWQFSSTGTSCFGEPASYFFKLGTVSTGDQNALDFNVFPNPVSHELTLEGISGMYSYKLIDLDGKVLRAELGNDRNVVDVFGLIPGVYILEVLQDGKADRVKVMKM